MIQLWCTYRIRFGFVNLLISYLRFEHFSTNLSLKYVLSEVAIPNLIYICILYQNLYSCIENLCLIYK